MREQLLPQHRVSAAQVVEQLARLGAERPNDANARECLANSPIDLFGILTQRAIDRAHASRKRQTHQHHARDDRQRGEGQPPVQRDEHGDGKDQPDDRHCRRYNRHLKQARRRIDVAGEAGEDPARFHVPQLRQRQMQQPIEQRTAQREHDADVE